MRHQRVTRRRWVKPRRDVLRRERDGFTIGRRSGARAPTALTTRSRRATRSVRADQASGVTATSPREGVVGAHARAALAVGRQRVGCGCGGSRPGLAECHPREQPDDGGTARQRRDEQQESPAPQESVGFVVNAGHRRSDGSQQSQAPQRRGSPRAAPSAPPRTEGTPSRSPVERGPDRWARRTTPTRRRLGGPRQQGLFPRATESRR